MKILLPFQDPYDNPLDHPVVSGGTEMFCKSLTENFDVEVYQIPYIKPDDSSHKDKQKTQQDIINKAENVGADVILNNFAWASFSGALMSKSHIPIMNVEHCFYPMTSIISRWNKLVDAGHSMFFVSEFQQKFYKQMAERTNNRIVEYNLINPAYCRTKPKIEEIEFDCGTIGRCDKEKNPFKLKHLTKNTDLKTLVLTNATQGHPKNDKYFERNKNWDNTLWGLPHNEVLKNISKCRTFFSTWNRETWGITALEALSCGIPVILNTDKDGDHASELIPASPEHFKKIPDSDGDALVDAINSFQNVDRKEIQEMTWEKHNQQSWALQIENAIDITIDRFKNNTSTVMDFMV